MLNKIEQLSMKKKKLITNIILIVNEKIIMK